MLCPGLRSLFIMLFSVFSFGVYPHGLSEELIAIDDREILGRAGEEIYTFGEAKELLSLRIPPDAESRIYGLPDLINAARRDCAWRDLADQARQRGLQLSATERERLQLIVQDAVNRKIFKESIAERVAEPTDGEIRSHYESIKEERFLLPERALIRVIYLDDQGTAESVYQRLKGGEDFLLLQQNFSIKSEASLLLELDNRLHVDNRLIDIVYALADFEFSIPFLNGEQWLIIRREFLLPESAISVDSVQQVIRDELRYEREQQISEMFLRELANRFPIKVNPANIINRGPLARRDDVLATIDAREFTRGELVSSAGWRLAPGVSMTEDYFLEMAVSLAPIQDELLARHAKERRLLNSESIKYIREAAEDTILTRKMLRLFYMENGETGDFEEYVDSIIDENTGDQGFEIAMGVWEYPPAE